MALEAVENLLEEARGGVYYAPGGVTSKAIQAAARRAGMAYFHVDGKNIARKEQLMNAIQDMLRQGGQLPLNRDGAVGWVYDGSNFARDGVVVVAMGQGAIAATDIHNRCHLPTEDEQYESYKAVTEALDGKPVTIRTLDIGADKQARALRVVNRDEPNPALGLRAIRYCLAEPKLFLTQLRAILRACRVELQSGEIGDDLAYYRSQSEQTPSAVGIGVFVMPDLSVEAAGGYLVQLLPGLSDDELGAIEQRIASLPHPTALLRDGTTPEQLLDRIFPDGWVSGGRQEVSFHCPCSRERFEAAIVSLGHDEVRRIIDEEDQPFTEVVCHFCNEAYHFSPAQMEAILVAASS